MSDPLNSVVHPASSSQPSPSDGERDKIRIVDVGRGPQIEGHRLTVMDVFYYLHRGHDFDFIHRAMPSLTREQFDVVADYVRQHRDELVKEDHYVDQCIEKEIAEQRAKGIYCGIDRSAPPEERISHLRQKIRRQ